MALEEDLKVERTLLQESGVAAMGAFVANEFPGIIDAGHDERAS